MADKWFVSLTVELDEAPKPCESQEGIGVDLGINRLASLSNGGTFEAPKPLKRYLSKWQPRELDVEKFIVSADSDNNILDPSVFGEPLLIVSNQVKTKFKKRADILAIDRYGNGVIIELKRDRGFLGV